MNENIRRTITVQIVRSSVADKYDVQAFSAGTLLMTSGPWCRAVAKRKARELKKQYDAREDERMEWAYNRRHGRVA